jgi:hypothetical protein
MTKSDKIIFGLFLGVLILVLISLSAGTAGYYFFKEERIPYFVAGGVLAGGITDILILKKLIKILFDLPAWILTGFYILSNIFIYGMFMGFPVFNILMGIVAGYYYGRRISVRNIGSSQREPLIRNVSLFTTLIMIMICISSAFIALREKTIGEELQGMLKLSFIPAKGLILTGIIIGGSMLIIAQYFITRLTMIKTIKHV